MKKSVLLPYERYRELTNTSISEPSFNPSASNTVVLEQPAAIEQQILKTQALSRADHGGAPLPDASAVASPWCLSLSALVLWLARTCK